jgi:hypothetical protein
MLSEPFPYAQDNQGAIIGDYVKRLLMHIKRRVIGISGNLACRAGMLSLMLFTVQSNYNQCKRHRVCVCS